VSRERFMNYLRRRDIQILSVLLILFLGWYGYTQYQIQELRIELEEIAAQNDADFFKGLEREKYDAILEVESGKTLGFLGRDWGVVRIYSRESGDATMETFEGIEYFYQRVGDAWTQQDSAAIREPKYIYEAYREFEATGHKVDDKAFTKYQR
jgi:hypothetical protein